VSQRLLPCADGKGRVVAAEVMIVTQTIRDLIRDRDRLTDIREYIAEGREQYGMQTFDQHLADLVRGGAVTFEVAMAAATRPSDFQLEMRTLNSDASLSSKSSNGQSRRRDEAQPEPREADGDMAGAGFEFLNSSTS